jgi:DNA-binding CsgD family transcriptional regulator
MAALWEDGRIFTPDNLRCMHLLAPHLDRALRLQMRLSAADLRVDMVSGAFDCLTLGVAFVERSGRPIWLNKRALEIINNSNALQLAVSAELAARRPSDTQSLRALITGAVSAGKQGLLAIGRGVGQRPLLLIARPLKPIGSWEPTIQLVWGVVFIIDPDRIDIPTVDSLRRAFDLTYREAHMAIAVAQGNGLQAAADATGVALTTARTQLQQVFAKTGTRQQAELAALVNRTLAVLRHD